MDEQEPGAAHTITHPRVVEGSVRRSDERRKQARAAPPSCKVLSARCFGLCISVQASQHNRLSCKVSSGTHSAGTRAEGKTQGGGGPQAAGRGQAVRCGRYSNAPLLFLEDTLPSTCTPAPLTCRLAISLVQTAADGADGPVPQTRNPVQGPQCRQGEGGGPALPGAGGP